MTPHDRESAAALVQRIERDGEWHLMGPIMVGDSDGDVICSVSGPMMSPKEDKQNAADIVETRRLLPIAMADLGKAQGEIDRLTRERGEARASRARCLAGWQEEERSAARWSARAVKAEAEADALRAALEIEGPAEHPLASLSSRDEQCECCGFVIPAGSDLAAFVEADGRQVFMHWGPCPEPAGDMWCVEEVYADGNRHRGILPWPYERAVAHARFLREDDPRIVSARLHRLRIRSRCTAPVDRPVPNGVECTYRQEPCGRPAVNGERCDRHGGAR